MKFKRILCVFFAAGLAAAIPVRCMKTYADYTAFAEEESSEECVILDAEDVWETGMGVISCMAGGEAYFLFSEEFCAGAGSSVNDWLAIGAGRFGITEDPGDYINQLKAVVKELYEGQNLSSVKATEWHRISLALLALGADPTDVDGIDLVADGTYNHARYGSLGRQGLNGWSFALITVDAAGTAVPEGSDYTREDMISAILECQLGNGGFALTGMGADVDLTAMALQALAPYYTRNGSHIGEVSEELLEQVDTAVSQALSWLSEVQCADGSFTSLGTANAESSAQVIIALTSLGIDPQTDARFLKENGSVVDGLMRFLMPDGGFAHALKEDGSAAQTNGLASAQSLCALAALYRFMSGQGRLYDFDEEIAGFSGSETVTNVETTENEPDAAETGEQVETVSDEIETPETEGMLVDDSEFAEDTSDDLVDEMQELEKTPEEEQSLPGYFVYLVATVVLILGVSAYFVMKKIGRQ